MNERAIGALIPGPYPVRNPRLWWYLRIADAVLRRVVRRRAQRPIQVRRLLLAVGGHLGDAVVLTAALRWLAREHADVEVGVVLPSWSQVVLVQYPGIKWRHSIDHWKNIRGQMSISSKYRRYRATVHGALNEIRLIGYDAAIDLHTHYPNMAVPLYQSGIPVRLGYESGGFGALYTDTVTLDHMRGHMAERHVAMLRKLFGTEDDAGDCRYALPASTASTARSTERLLGERVPDRNNYLVLHMRAGATGRDWPAHAWRELLLGVESPERTIVLTGAGETERAAIAAVTKNISGCVSLCDELAWPQFVHLIRHARLVITVDTVAAHVAAATGTPSVVVWPSVTDATLWRPFADNAHLVSRDARPCEVARLINTLLEDAQTTETLPLAVAAKA